MDIAALEALFEDTLSAEKSSKTGLPPVHLWNPDLTGIMDLIIDREGRWIHEGREIKRPALVKLFSTILKQEDHPSTVCSIFFSSDMSFGFRLLVITYIIY